jgi:hypothetical protein
MARCRRFKRAGTKPSRLQVFPVQVQEQLLTWSDNGFMLLQGFFDNAMVSSVNHEIDKIVQKDLIKPTHDNKLPFANKVSPIIKKFNILIN